MNMQLQTALWTSIDILINKEYAMKPTDRIHFRPLAWSNHRKLKPHARSAYEDATAAGLRKAFNISDSQANNLMKQSIKHVDFEIIATPEQFGHFIVARCAHDGITNNVRSLKPRLVESFDSPITVDLSR